MCCIEVRGGQGDATSIIYQSGRRGKKEEDEEEEEEEEEENEEEKEEEEERQEEEEKGCPHDALAGCWCLKQEYAPRNARGGLASFQRTNSAAGPPFRHVTVPLPPRAGGGAGGEGGGGRGGEGGGEGGGGGGG